MKNLVKTNKPLLLGIFEIALENQIVSYTLKRSLRGHLVWLKIHSEKGLIVTVPFKYELADLPPFLISKSSWILRHLKRLQSEVPSSCPDPNANPPLVRYQGYPLQCIGENHNKRYRLPDSSMLEYADVLTWLRHQAKEVIHSKVLFHSEKIGVRFAKISIRDQKTRWGSCSQVGNLNFNWRLIMAPEPVMDYVIIHELCHLKRMHHARSFWNVVEKYCPDWKDKRRWLNKHSHELHYFHSNSA